MEPAERRSNAVSLSRETATVITTVGAAAVIGIGGFIFSAADRVGDLAEELAHFKETAEIRSSAFYQSLNGIDERIKDFESFQRRGERFTHGDGKRHERRIEGLEKYVLDHDRWGREFAGKLSEQVISIERRLDRLERWQGVKE